MTNEKKSFIPIDPITAYVPIGTCPSNTYFGSSQALSTVYKQVTLGEDDIIYEFVGGLFVKFGDQPDTMFRARFTEPKRHPFEHGGNRDSLDSFRGSLFILPYSGSHPPVNQETTRFESMARVRELGGREWGGLPDFII